MYHSNQRTDHNYVLKKSSYQGKKYRRCKVPSCDNNTITTPNKLFLRVPIAGSMRRQWLAAAGVIASASGFSKTPDYFFCEDHFEIDKDIENYMAYKMGYTKRIRVKNGCMPTKFSCQNSESVLSSIIKIDVLQGKNILTIETVMTNKLEPSEPGLIVDVDECLVTTPNSEKEELNDSGQGYHKEYYNFIKSKLKPMPESQQNNSKTCIKKLKSVRIHLHDHNYYKESLP